MYREANRHVENPTHTFIYKNKDEGSSYESTKRVLIGD